MSTSAWAKALTDIKVSTGHSIVQELLPCQQKDVHCYFGSVTSMGSLNVSVVCMHYLLNFFISLRKNLTNDLRKQFAVNLWMNLGFYFY